MKAGFDARYRALAGLVEECLEARFPVGEEPYRELLEAVRYSLLGGGKRVRGVLTLGVYELFDPEVERALPFAAAVEMVHAYSLIHDDLPCMDDDDLRRGKPSCHIAFGEATALLAGDGLLTAAFETAAGCGAFPPERSLAATLCLARAAGIHGMIGGQAMDLKNGGKPLGADELDGINRRKTGALFEACAEIGGILGGGDGEALDAVRRYGRHLGAAFQLVDDLLDRTATSEALGKPVGSDAANQKSTYASVYGIEACRKRVAELNRQANAALESIGRDTAFLCGLVDAMGGRKR